MKSRIALVLGILVLFAAAPSNAQVLAGWGAKGGVNFAKLVLDPKADSTDFKTAGTVGIFIRWRINDNWSFDTEGLFYDMRGGKNGGAGEDVNVTLNYVQVPLLIDGSFGGGNVRPFVVAGVNLGGRVQAKAKVSGQEIDLSDDFRSGDMEIAVGGGVRFSKFSIEARFANSFIEILKLDQIRPNTQDENGAKNRAVTVLVGVELPH